MDSLHLYYAAVAVLVAAPVLSAQPYAANLSVDHPAIRYSDAPLDNPVERLAARMEAGAVHLAYNATGLGYLPDLLARLGVNADSQALVFSKTSFQAARISPRNPRAIYFSDDVAVGFVRGSEDLEVAVLDPRQAVIFYTLTAPQPGRPRLSRSGACLKCHQGPATLGVPGIFAGSVYPNVSGWPDRSGAIVTDHRTPFEDRWGGWYVNARSGQLQDRANAVAPDPAQPHTLETGAAQNLVSLVKKVNTAGYLQPLSDIVSLMTFEHQTRMTNLIARLGWEARMNAAPDRLEADIRDTIRYMLFQDEAPMREPIQGVSTFTKTFPERGPRDRQGRSLRDFDLRTRLFRYPLSYMIYSPAFDALPGAVRNRLYRELYGQLKNRDQAIMEILRDTKPNLPDYWRPRV